MHVNEPLLREIIKTQGILAKKVDVIEDGMSRISIYLENDDKTGKKGLIYKQHDMSVRLSNIENDRENEKIKIKTTIKVVSTISALVSTATAFVVKYFFFK